MLQASSRVAPQTPAQRTGHLHCHGAQCSLRGRVPAFQPALGRQCVVVRAQGASGFLVLSSFRNAATALLALLVMETWQWNCSYTAPLKLGLGHAGLAWRSLSGQAYAKLLAGNRPRQVVARPQTLTDHWSGRGGERADGQRL